MIINNLIKLLPKPKRIEGRNKKVLNLLKSPEDNRDKKYAQCKVAATVLPLKISLRPLGYKIKNQGTIGSCGSHAFATILELELQNFKPNWRMPLSELWHYYTVRQPEFGGQFPKDSGQYLRDGAKVLAKYGISPEKLCPYNTNKFNDKPGIFATMFAHYWKIKSYHRCYDVKAIKTSLAEKHAVAFGVPVDLNFLRFRGKGIIEKLNFAQRRGGHAMAIIGYDDEKKAFEVENSWGTYWGDKGHCWISYDFIKKNLYDAWSVRV